jgi:hypothetical protein
MLTVPSVRKRFYCRSDAVVSQEVAESNISIQSASALTPDILQFLSYEGTFHTMQSVG